MRRIGQGGVLRNHERRSQRAAEMWVPLIVNAPNAASAGPRRVVALLSISQTVAWGALYYSFGVLLQPFASHLAVSEAAVAGAFSLALLCSGAAAWIVGTSIDRWGPRPVMTTGAVLALGTLASLGSVDTLLGFYAGWAVMGLSYAGVLYEPAFAAIAKWFFSPGQRARALLTVTTVAGFASTIFIPLTATLYDRFGLQRTLLLLAALVGVIVVPMNVALPRQGATRARTGGHPMRDAPSARSRSAIAVFAIVFSMQAFASAGVAVHLVSHLRGEGLDLSTAATLTGLMGAAQVPARLCFQLFRRLAHPRARLPILLGVQAVALVGILGRASAVVTPAALIWGAANGLVTLERAAVIADAFGTEQYGAISGRIAAVAHVTRAAGPLAVGLVKMASSSYAIAFVALAVLTALAGVIMLRCEIASVTVPSPDPSREHGGAIDAARTKAHRARGSATLSSRRFSCPHPRLAERLRL